MKPFYFLLLAILLSCTSGRGQSLYRCPQSGFMQTEVYHWDYTTQFWIENKSIFLVDDTVVGVDTFFRYAISSPFAPQTFRTTYDSGKVYLNPPYSNPSGGSLLYDFSLQVGDTFTFPVMSFMHSGSFVVDSVGSVVMINSQIRKYLRLTNGSFSVEWIDAIGDIEYGFLYSTSWEGSHEEFICNQDSSGSVYLASNTTFNCDPFNPVGSNGPNVCDQFTFQAQINGPACVSCTGSIAITNVTGGTPPYSYYWSNGNSTSNPSGLCEGPISLSITDSMGLRCTRTFYVSDSPMIATTSVQEIGTCSNNYMLCATVTGGTPPYTYTWIPSVIVGNCFTVYMPFSATFTVYITDANGCTVMDTLNVMVPTALNVTDIVIPPSCSTCCDGDIALNIVGGTPPFVIAGNPTWPGAGSFCGGWYSYCVTDSIGCTFCDSVYVQAPSNVMEIDQFTFELFPNPADAHVLLQSSSIGDDVFVADLSGKTILELKIVSSTTEIDTANLSDGIYFLKVRDHTERLVICR